MPACFACLGLWGRPSMSRLAVNQSSTTSLQRRQRDQCSSLASGNNCWHTTHTTSLAVDIHCDNLPGGCLAFHGIPVKPVLLQTAAAATVVSASNLPQQALFDNKENSQNTVPHRPQHAPRHFPINMAAAPHLLRRCRSCSPATISLLGQGSSGRRPQASAGLLQAAAGSAAAAAAAAGRRRPRRDALRKAQSLRQCVTHNQS